MLVVLTGTSFSGKSTMQNMLLKQKTIDGNNLRLFKTCTTRKKRQYEIDTSEEKLPYKFLSKDEFILKINSGQFFEHVVISKGDHDDFYGSLKSDISNAVKSNDIYIAVFEPEGASKIKKMFPETEIVFIFPPSIAELVRRAEIRNTETLSDVRARIERAENIELKFVDSFDFKVLNKNIPDCYTDIVNYIKKSKKERK